MSYELLHEPCKANPSRPFLSAAIRSLETFVGLGPNFLLFPPTKRMLGIIDNSLARSLWEFLHIYGITLNRLTGNHKQFDNDELIMEKIYIYSFDTADIRMFNYCRIFLQITRLSEIISLDGKRIRSHIWEGNKVRHVVDDIQWFNQPCPTKKAWNRFRLMLTKIFNTNQDGILFSQVHITSWNRSMWKWFYCPVTSILYEALESNRCIMRSIQQSTYRRSNRAIMSFALSGYPGTIIPASASPFTSHSFHATSRNSS